MRRFTLEIMSTAANLTARCPEQRENQAEYQHDDPGYPENVNREHKPQDEEDNTDENQALRG